MNQIKRFFYPLYKKQRDSSRQAGLYLSVDIDGKIFTDIKFDLDKSDDDYTKLVEQYSILIFLINTGGISKLLCDNIIRTNKIQNNKYEDIISKTIEIEESFQKKTVSSELVKKPSQVFIYDK